jgi:hypothetical protein
MIISAITIENFKSISAPVRIELKPITLLYGPNSVGKSSVIQALHYAREIICNQANPDIDKVELGGNLLRLGGFNNIVHGHDPHKSIRLRFEIGLQFDKSFQEVHHEDELYYLTDDIQVLDETHKYSAEDGHNVPDFFDTQIAQGNLPWLEIIIKNETKLGVSVYSSSVGFGETTFLAWAGLPYSISKVHSIDTGNMLVPLADNESISSLCMKAINALESFTQDEIRYEIENRFDPQFSWIFVNQEDDSWMDVNQEDDNAIATFFAGYFAEMKSDRIEHKSPDALKAVPSRLLQLYLFMGRCVNGISELEYDDKERNFTIDKELLAIYLRFRNLTNVVCNIISESVQYDLKKLSYIGPLREVPQLSSPLPQNIDKVRWANGLAAWDTMKLSGDAIDSVNNWFDTERFNTGYTIEKELFKEVGFNEAKELIGHFLLEDPNRVSLGQQTEIAEKLTKMLEKLPTVRVQLSLYDKANNVRLQPSDIGVGISQLLPIILLAVGGDIDDGMIAIEQPELHIHPIMQLMLGDLFIDGLRNQKYGENRKRFIIETHSEHLLLRLLRRIRESPDHNFNKSSLAIHILEPSKNGTSVIHIGVDEDGEFTDPWPRGFFNERSEELF